MHEIKAPLRSFLKWAGGKTRSATTLASLSPDDGYETYLEPFCGSAAVFFAVRPRRACIADANEDLIVCLRQVADDAESVMARLDEWPNTKQFFLKVRAWDAASLDDSTRAARVVYLNKTAFRGLWRVNRSGQFNAPYGAYNRPVYNRDTLLAASQALRGHSIVHADFRDVLLKASAGDWVYLDPPYVPDRKWGDFTRYTAGQFGPEDQVALAEMLGQLDRDGVRWLLSNSDTPLVRELYSAFSVQSLATRRDITLQSADRKSVDLVISNYPLPVLSGLRAAG